ncbi:MAG TPA: hypothetical protein VGP07_25355 [Polyangia bacterium]
MREPSRFNRAVFLGALGALGALGTSLTLVAAGGCGQPPGQFFVVQNQSPGAGCTLPMGTGTAYQGEGTLDVRVPASSESAYTLFPLVENDFPSDGTDAAQPNRVALSGFEVDVTFVDGSAAAAAMFTTMASDPTATGLLHYQTPWSGSVAPGGGLTSASTSAFPAETAIRLRDSGVLADHAYVRVTANVRAVGDRRTGHVTSDVFKYPLRICDGCLINSITTCPATTAVLTGGICNPGQDSPVDCCTQGTALICPATTAAAQ